MKERSLTPFSEEKREDCIATLAYIQDLNKQIKELNDKKKEAVQWLIETIGYDPSVPGTFHFGDENNFVSFEVSREYKVDADKVQELIQENQLSEETAEKVFRWKAEVNAAGYKALTDEQKTILAYAVTSKTNSPSIKINLTEEK